MKDFKELKRDLDFLNRTIEELPKNADKQTVETLRGRILGLVEVVKTTMNLVIEGHVHAMESIGQHALQLTIGEEIVDRKGRYVSTAWTSLSVTREEYESAMREREEAENRRKKKNKTSFY